MKEILSDDEINHPLNEQLLEEAERVRNDRRTLKERMDKLEETRPSVSDAVYQRVKSDYNAKMQQSTERMMSLRRNLETEEKRLLEKKLSVEANIKFHKEKIEESALRQALGEFSPSDHEALMTAEAQEIARLEMALGKLSEGLGRHKQIFEGEDLPHLPKADTVAKPVPARQPTPPPAPAPARPSRPPPPPLEDDEPELETMRAPKPIGDYTTRIPVVEGHTDVTLRDDDLISEVSKTGSERPRHAGELMVLENGKVIQTLSLDRTIQIGRSPSNDVVLKEPKVSRKHAEIQYIGGKYIILDLESSNGTYVGGKRVSEQVLQPNDEIVIGNTKMVFKG